MKKILVTLSFIFVLAYSLIGQSIDIESKLMSDANISAVNLFPQAITDEAISTATANYANVTNTTEMSEETYEALLGEGMGFLAVTNDPIVSNIQTTLQTEESEVITNFEFSKKYFRAVLYSDTETPFWFSHFRSVWEFIKDSKNNESSKESYYWELNNYLKGTPVNRDKFKK